MNRVSFITTTWSCLFVLQILLLIPMIGCATRETPPESTATASVAEKDVETVPKGDGAGKAPRAQSQNLARMQGRWQSNDDARAVIEITGDDFSYWYDEEQLDTGTLAFVNDCEQRSEDPESEYFTVSAEGGELCYYLIRVDESVLEYSYVARGNTLSYKRIGG